MMLPSPEMHPEWRDWARALLQVLAFKKDEGRLQPYTQAALPQAQRAKYMMVYCTDLATPQPVYSDGVNWRRVTDGTTV